MRTQECAPLKHHYDECAERVTHQQETDGHAKENCVEECEFPYVGYPIDRSQLIVWKLVFHLMHCATTCAAPKLFKQLR